VPGGGIGTPGPIGVVGALVRLQPVRSAAQAISIKRAPEAVLFVFVIVVNS
jgi:hypothetical protein